VVEAKVQVSKQIKLRRTNKNKIVLQKYYLRHENTLELYKRFNAPERMAPKTPLFTPKYLPTAPGSFVGKRMVRWPFLPSVEKEPTRFLSANISSSVTLQVIHEGVYGDLGGRRVYSNGFFAGNHRAALDGLHLLTASADSKVNLWDIKAGRLLWSNSRSDARFKAAALNADRAIVVGSYDQEGYLQLYERATGDVIHEQLVMDGGGFTDVAASSDKVVALLSVRHKLLTCKAIILDSLRGDLISEQTFVDVLAMNLIHDRVLVLVNNQVGDFRTRISIYDLDSDDVSDAANGFVVNGSAFGNGGVTPTPALRLPLLLLAPYFPSSAWLSNTSTTIGAFPSASTKALSF
jgi:hypothetical protein